MTGADLGRSPIRPEAPAGDDVRDQDVFVDLQAEMNRSQTVTSGASAVVDWSNIRKISASILESRSKDLLVAAYFSVAMAKTEGPAGAVEGISLLNAMVAEHWEALFPPISRLRARRTALSWWMTQMQEILPALSSPPLSPEVMAQGVREIRELNAALGEKDPDGPSLSPLYPLVEGLPVTLPETPPLSPSESTGTPARAPSSAPSPDRPENTLSISQEGDPLTTLEEISPALLSLADRLLEADPEDSRSHVLSRLILWEGIREMPSNEEGMTRIPAPPPHVLSALETLLEGGGRR